MSTVAVEQLLFLYDASFDGEDWHALVQNLRDLTPEEWIWTPPGGEHSVRDLVAHVGGCPFMYENHAFGDASLTWDDALVKGDGALDSPEPAIAWLREGHARLRASIATLDDAELTRPRMTNWGEPRETRWIITIMIQHDLYHAGEINHLRALYRDDDCWEHERES